MDGFMKKKLVLSLLASFIFFQVISFAANATTSRHENKPFIKRILLITVLDAEAIPIIKMLDLHPLKHTFSKLPMKGYEGKYKTFNILLLKSGKSPIYHVENIGTQPAALTTYLGIQYFHPDLVINIGIAGGILKNGAQIGDIYVSRKIYFFDRRMPPDKMQYGMGGYPSFNLGNIPKKIGLKIANVCSGDSFDRNKTDYKIILKNKCAVRNMEAAGVAWVCVLMQTPMIAIKGITDIHEIKNGYYQSQRNRSYVIKKLTEKLKKLLNTMSKEENYE